MNKLIFNELEFLYEIKDCEDGEYSMYKWFETDFYLGSTKKYYKKYWLFGEKLCKDIPTFAFTIDIDIEDIRYTKEEIYLKIQKAFNIYNKKKQRLLEINTGQII